MSRERITLLIFIFLVIIGLFIYKDAIFGDKKDANNYSKAKREMSNYNVVPLSLDYKKRTVPAFEADGRNLFSYGQQPPSIAKYISRMEEEERKARLALEKKQEREEALKTSEVIEKEKAPKVKRAPVPPVFYDFIGYIGPDSEKIAIFRERDQKFLKVGKVGDFFDNYIIKEIGYESVLLGFKNSDAEKRIPLAEGD